jgi:hypothetical protein
MTIPAVTDVEFTEVAIALAAWSWLDAEIRDSIDEPTAFITCVYKLTGFPVSQ